MTDAPGAEAPVRRPRKPRYKKMHLGLRIDPSIRKALEDAARENECYMTDVATLFLKQRLIAEGFMEPEPEEETKG